ncbi:hypothetical protein GQ600_16293 [Phytophthora cactorum]|nr:hypothetical protein GQ600_16293 [Phytophthora cactorum]
MTLNHPATVLKHFPQLNGSKRLKRHRLKSIPSLTLVLANHPLTEYSKSRQHFTNSTRPNVPSALCHNTSDNFDDPSSHEDSDSSVVTRTPGAHNNNYVSNTNENSDEPRALSAPAATRSAMAPASTRTPTAPATRDPTIPVATRSPRNENSGDPTSNEICDGPNAADLEDSGNDDYVPESGCEPASRPKTREGLKHDDLFSSMRPSASQLRRRNEKDKNVNRTLPKAVTRYRIQPLEKIHSLIPENEDSIDRMLGVNTITPGADEDLYMVFPRAVKLMGSLSWAD